MGRNPILKTILCAILKLKNIKVCSSVKGRESRARTLGLRSQKNGPIFFIFFLILSRRRQLRAELYGIILSAILFELFLCECAHTLFLAIWQPLYTFIKYFFGHMAKKLV